MGTSPRAIIEEAYYRSNIVPGRGMKPRGDQMESAFELLQGIVKHYNNDNYLACQQNEFIINAPFMVNHIYNGDANMCMPEDVVIVDSASDLPSTSDLPSDTYGFCTDEPSNVYKIDEDDSTWYVDTSVDVNDYRVQEARRYMSMKHIILPKVEKLLSVMYSSSLRTWVKLCFLPYHEFDRAAYDANVYTYMQRGDNEWVIKIKPALAKSNIALKLTYNESLDIDLNKDLFIPDAYIELLIVALTHKLALVHPRLDEAQMSRLSADLVTMQNNIKTPKAESKMILRDDTREYNSSYRGILTGAFI